MSDCASGRNVSLLKVQICPSVIKTHCKDISHRRYRQITKEAVSSVTWNPIEPYVHRDVSFIMPIWHPFEWQNLIDNTQSRCLHECVFVAKSPFDQLRLLQYTLTSNDTLWRDVENRTVNHIQECIWFFTSSWSSEWNTMFLPNEKSLPEQPNGVRASNANPLFDVTFWTPYNIDMRMFRSLSFH